MNMQTFKQRQMLDEYSKLHPFLSQREMIEMKRVRTGNLLGFIGMLFIQGATLPSLYNVVALGLAPPPITLLVGVFVGLCFYQARAVRNIKHEWIYVIGNTIGMISNFTLILLSI